MTPRIIGLVVAAGIGIAFLAMARTDLRTSRVVVRQARWTTAAALIGLSAVAALDGSWSPLVGAAISAVVVTAIQLVPYGLQRRRGGEWIGRADVRLAVPFGWTLGWFGLGFAFVGYLAALLSGLAFGLVADRRRIPFVPFLTLGLWVGLGWAALRLR